MSDTQNGAQRHDFTATELGTTPRDTSPYDPDVPRSCFGTVRPRVRSQAPDHLSEFDSGAAVSRGRGVGGPRVKGNPSCRFRLKF